MALALDDALLAELAALAEGVGLLRLGAVDLDHRGFAPARAALATYLDRGAEGEMGFMTRTREVRMDPAQMLPGARTALVALVPYAGEPGPIARYAQWSDYHSEIHRRLGQLSQALEARLPGARSLICVDTKPVLERAVASLAGLGFIGKSGCLIAPGLGSYVLLGVLLTTAVFVGRDRAVGTPTNANANTNTNTDAPDAPIRAPWDACGSCRLCLDHCPTDAFDGPGRLDPRRCIAYLTIEHRGPIAEPLAAAIGQRVAGCDVCQEVCPYNRSAQRAARIPAVARLPKPAGRPREPDLARLATIGSNQHRQFVKHTPLNRIPRRALRRNAIIALANGEGLADEAEAAALRQAARDADEALAALARWAAARRGLELDEERGDGSEAPAGGSRVP